MSAIVIVLFSLSALLIAYLLNPSFFLPTAGPLTHSPLANFGAAKTSDDNDQSIRPFKIKFDAEQMENLHGKLNETIFFDSLVESKFHYGVNDAFLRKFRDYWLKSYDWQKWVDVLNENSEHSVTKIAGLNVHFARTSVTKSSESRRIRPVLLLHGWPGSFFEFYKLIPLLKKSPRDYAFDVITPSIPGYGFSDKPAKIGFGPIAAAKLFGELMIHRLKFTKFYCQGGDWGSLICTYMAQIYPDNVLGIHINMAPTPIGHPTVWFKMILAYFAPSLVFKNPAVDHAKLFPFGDKFLTLLQESGYFHMQATKPDTIGFALLNSPMALAAYIAEKFSTWTNLEYRSLTDGGLNRQHFSLDELLTNVMIYYVTDTILSSQRFYKEYMSNPETALYDRNKVPAKVHVGIASFPHEPIKTAPREILIYKYENITTYDEMPRGGHFAALEEPELLAQSFERFVCVAEGVCESV